MINRKISHIMTEENIRINIVEKFQYMYQSKYRDTHRLSNVAN